MNKCSVALRFLIILICTSFLCGNLESSSKRGAEIVVQKNDSTQLHGELIAVKKKSLLLLDSESGIDVSAPIEEIEIIHILKGPKTGLGAISGFLIGGAVGAAAVSKSRDCNQCPSSAQRNLIGGALVGSLGALVGALIGSSAGGNELIIIQGLPQEELNEVLEGLRSKARIRNFQ